MRFLLSLLVLLPWVLAQLPAQAADVPQQRMLCVHGVVAPDQLNVRAGPDFEATVVARFPANACGVQLVGKCTNGWCEMALKGTRGWVYTKHIAVYDVPRGHPSAQKQAISPELPRADLIEQGSSGPAQCVARVDRGDTLRIRTGPGVDNDEIGSIPPGACNIQVAGGCKGRWCKISWQGRVGWVNTYYLD